MVSPAKNYGVCCEESHNFGSVTRFVVYRQHEISRLASAWSVFHSLMYNNVVFLQPTLTSTSDGFCVFSPTKDASNAEEYELIPSI